MEKELNIIAEESKYILLEEINTKKYFICREQEGSVEIENTFLGTRYYSEVIIKNNKYEAIEFPGFYSQDIMIDVFNSIKVIDKNLNESVEMILGILKSFEDKVNLNLVRGTFAEIWSMLNNSIKPKPMENSIYDFIDDSNKDIEIKSFSRVKREIKVSYQQLINNEDALIYALEIYESNKGESLKEIYQKIPFDLKGRYGWVERTSSKLADVKFETGELRIYRTKDLSQGLSLPKLANDAKFVFPITK